MDHGGLFMYCNKFYLLDAIFKIEKLNVATAAISLVYIIIPLLSALILKESLSLKTVLGFSLIVGGVILTQVGNV